MSKTLTELTQEPNFIALVKRYIIASKSNPMEQIQMLYDFDEPKKTLNAQNQKLLNTWLNEPNDTASWLPAEIKVARINTEDFTPNVAKALLATSRLLPQPKSPCSACGQTYMIGSKCSANGSYHMK